LVDNTRGRDGWSVKKETKMHREGAGRGAAPGAARGQSRLSKGKDKGKD